MGNKEDLSTLKETISNIADENTSVPTMPVYVYAQEAEDLYYWCINDADKFEAAGVCKCRIEELLTRAGACRTAQSVWVKELNLRKDASKEWFEKSPEAYELRQELMHTFEYAFRKDKETQKTLDLIQEGTGHADMIQDLNDLVVLGNAHTELLQRINFDMSKIEKAEIMSDEMAGILAAANGEKQKTNETKIFRDKAYTHLKEIVDEVRACGKYLFWKDDNKLKGYRSAYLRKKNLKRKEN